MPKCSFCGEMYEIPRGVTKVMNDGRILYLCSSKCRKNMAMKRRKVRWVSDSSVHIGIEKEEKEEKEEKNHPENAKK